MALASLVPRDRAPPIMLARMTAGFLRSLMTHFNVLVSALMTMLFRGHPWRMLLMACHKGPWQLLILKALLS